VTHACRKFPSPVGKVLRDGIAAVCGGCMASTAGSGKDPFVERDPYCWKGVKESNV
jgi:hypothetical protein